MGIERRAEEAPLAHFGENRPVKAFMAESLEHALL